MGGRETTLKLFHLAKSVGVLAHQHKHADQPTPMCLGHVSSSVLSFSSLMKALPG